ncbi:MAG: hypothetical protein ABIF88_01775 [archaeon]
MAKEKIAYRVGPNFRDSEFTARPMDEYGILIIPGGLVGKHPLEIVIHGREIYTEALTQGINTDSPLVTLEYLPVGTIKEAFNLDEERYLKESLNWEIDYSDWNKKTFYKGPEGKEHLVALWESQADFNYYNSTQKTIGNLRARLETLKN